MLPVHPQTQTVEAVGTETEAEQVEITSCWLITCNLNTSVKNNNSCCHVRFVLWTHAGLGCNVSRVDFACALLELCEPEMEKEAETEFRVEVEEDVTDFTRNEATKEPAAEDFSGEQLPAETETEVVTETPKPEPWTEPVSSAQGTVEEDVSAEEDKAAVCAEPASAGGVKCSSLFIVFAICCGSCGSISDMRCQRGMET